MPGLRTTFNSFSSGFASNRFGFRDFNRFGNFGRFRFHPPFFGSPFLNFNDFFFFRNPFLFNSFFFQNPFLFNGFFFQSSFFFNDFFFRPPFFFNDFFLRRPFLGCFGCGFGSVGFNFGFDTPLWWGSGWPGWFGGIGDPLALPHGYSLPYDSAVTYNSPATDGSQSDNSSASGGFQRTRGNTANSSAPLLLYLKDGTMYSLRDCWLVPNCIAHQ